MKLIWALLLTFASVTGYVFDFVQLGGIPSQSDIETMTHNQKLLNSTLNSLEPSDQFLLPNETFHLLGGIHVTSLVNNVLDIQGTLKFSNNRETWPVDADGHVMECMYFDSLEKVTFTNSLGRAGDLSARGTLDGNGAAWWGAIQYLEHQEDRPRLLHVGRSKDLIIEFILLKDSPFWTTWLQNCDGLVIRYSDVDAKVFSLVTYIYTYIPFWGYYF